MGFLFFLQFRRVRLANNKKKFGSDIGVLADKVPAVSFENWKWDFHCPEYLNFIFEASLTIFSCLKASQILMNCLLRF